MQAFPINPKKILLVVSVLIALSGLEIKKPILATTVSTNHISIFNLQALTLYKPNHNANAKNLPTTYLHFNITPTFLWDNKVSMFPKLIAPCSADSLNGSVQGWSINQEGLGGNFYIKNTSSQTCSLFTANQIQIIDANGRALPISNPVTSGFWGTPLPSSFVLKPNDMILGLIIWSNWCLPAPKWNINLRITIRGNQGQLTVPITDNKGTPLKVVPRCNLRNSPSSLLVQYLDVQSR